MRLTIAYITGRAEPRLDWVIDDLILRQMQRGDEIEIIVVDLRGRRSNELVTADIAEACGIAIRTTLPKPNIWQGSHRIMPVDWWAKSNAINTALVLCQTEYIAFVDDRCSLSPEWLNVVREGERKRESVIAGAYEKIERGQATQDHRLTHAPHGRNNCGGNWLYGCTFALPLEWALVVNGAEEGCDGMGGEDYIFGLMLANAGYRIDYAPAMKVTQKREEVAAVPGGSGSIPLRRTDKGVSPNDKSHAALSRFGSRKRAEFTPDLRGLRYELAQGRGFPIPDPNYDYRDWYDNQPIREMQPPP